MKDKSLEKQARHETAFQKEDIQKINKTRKVAGPHLL